MADRRRGFDDELYLDTPATSSSQQNNLVEPLRIHKPHSPESRAGSSSSGRVQYPPQATAIKQSFSPPPANPAPLPYPDDDRSTLDHRRPVYADSVGSDNSWDSSDAAGHRQASSDRRGPGLAERRGTGPKPLPESPGPEIPDKETSYGQQARREQRTNDARRPAQYAGASHPDVYKHYVPPPIPQTPEIAAPKPRNDINRFASTASNMTTRASRGSPPPPETPIVGPDEAGGGIEARYAAAGISGPATLTHMPTQSAAAAQRAHQYSAPPVPQLPQSPSPDAAAGRRPWTPTEVPGTMPHGPSTVYQGANQLPTGGSSGGLQRQDSIQTGTLEQDFRRMQMASVEPPPAYSSVIPGPNGANTASGYPAEKQSHQQQQNPAGSQASGSGSATAHVSEPASQQPTSPGPMSPNFQHPAFAVSEHERPELMGPQPGTETLSHYPNAGTHATNVPNSPPPLPEGWIAHLDQNSGQYYYIHLATQATQWEFPKGPTPLNHETPHSPVHSTYGSTYGNALVSPGLNPYGKTALSPGLSPGFPPHTPGYAESIMSMASQTPTAAGFTGPPPSAGVDIYKVAPTNNVYFGPYLRYTNIDMEHGIWLGSILLITDAPQPPTIHIHKTIDLSPNPRQLKPNPIHNHQRWTFYRYDIDLQMNEGPGDKWTYAITSHLGCTRYEFLVAGRYETNWRFIAHSGNDFAMNTNANDRAKLGGVGFMWKDILQKNVECGGFHVQLGLGDQIYGDRLWKEIPLLKQWLATSGKDNRRTAAWTARHEEEVTHAYFHYYTSHFDQPYLREAFAQIPHILQIDDHDIFDGYGSYPDYMQTSHMFKNIGRIGIENYLLFQHHTTLEILRNVSSDRDLFTITGSGWHFVKYLGPAVVVVGPDCRSERNQRQVMAGPTYQGLFPKVAVLPPSVQHCIWMVSVPVVYPRLEAIESLAHTITTGKKAVTGTYNLLGKVTSSVAGVVGGKDAVASGFTQVKKAVGKSGLMGGVLNSFGDIDIADELRDMWTHESKDLERTYLIRTLQGIAQQKGIRMTFLSGDVNCCGAGLVHDPSHPSDHKTMYQVIASAVVAAPPPSYVLKMLHNNKPLYVPLNGQKTTNAVSDTKEDMMEIFQTDTNGGPRELKKLMGRRNYVAFVAYDPEAIAGTSYAGSMHSGHPGLAKLSLAVDFVVQGDSGFAPPTKYGPVIIPSLEFGR